MAKVQTRPHSVRDLIAFISTVSAAAEADAWYNTMLESVQFTAAIDLRLLY